MSEWQPIETAPKDGSPIRVYDPRHPFTGTLPRLVRWDGHGWYRLDRSGFLNMYVPASHWQPLSEPPAP